MKKSYCVISGKYRKFDNLKRHTFFKKTLFLSIICSNCKNEEEKIIIIKKSIEILKMVGLIKNI